VGISNLKGVQKITAFAKSHLKKCTSKGLNHKGGAIFDSQPALSKLPLQERMLEKLCEQLID